MISLSCQSAPNHWTLLIIDIARKFMIELDSLGRDNSTVIYQVLNYIHHGPGIELKTKNL